mmetsp:Transcript_77420/g.121803  ORF Transcript_77420/g.121803 Transcript_77420/m.121803 type:complete len:249 (-) Transcript_77420:888-1634(-)
MSAPAATRPELPSCRAATTISGHSAAKRCQNSARRIVGDTSRMASRNSSRETSPELSSSQRENSSAASMSTMPSFASDDAKPSLSKRADDSCMLPAAWDSSRNACGMEGYLTRSRCRISDNNTARGMWVRASRNSFRLSDPSPSASITLKKWPACCGVSPKNAVAFTNSASGTIRPPRPRRRVLLLAKYSSSSRKAHSRDLWRSKSKRRNSTNENKFDPSGASSSKPISSLPSLLIAAKIRRANRRSP